ncbi:MAG: hypothetical protein IJY55_02800 [Clostridia bacterium]|nr:hypothetical protein [Clostridia bacterium]
MNKKICIIIIATILFLAICGILYHYLVIPQNQHISPEDAEKLCYSVLGDKDENTGFPFSFGVTETIEKDGKEYYVIRASWLVNNNHMSYIGDFFVSVDGKEMYTGLAWKDEYTIETLIWSK